jgi:hypothetical protein
MRMLRQARKTILLSLLADGEPRHTDELIVLNQDYTSVPRPVRRELLRELIREGLVSATPCPRDGRRWTIGESRIHGRSRRPTSGGRPQMRECEADGLVILARNARIGVA